MSEKKSRPSGPGRPKDPAKRRAILHAAQELFLRNGYEGTSMEAIAGEAGVSKLTVYSHFTDKDTLYAAAIRHVCESQMPQLFFEHPAETDIRTLLARIGDAFCVLINGPESLALHRLLVRMAGQDAKLAQLFYEAGPQRVCEGMVQVLQGAASRGELEVETPINAARHFFCLLKGDHNFRLLIGYDQPMNAADRQRHVAEVVEIFLRIYGTDTAC
ncbi:TetR/AcrR family transcriptional regulator [Halopseudomonas bauzanensis]|uniref:TetR/AcrR family transcriptional regulator n=1 Tax=Halopseudomonas bauzanensis TaxID=653930 RepID=UPI0025549503|nr:TetR/AcrR family transcriptional regulator [Halopseudomonas bauzanensis]